MTYHSGQRGIGAAAFDVLVDGECVGHQTVTRRRQDRFFDVEYAIPSDLVRGKEKVTVRFQATDGNSIAAVFGIRMIRVNAEAYQYSL